MFKRLSPTAIGRWSTRRPALAIAAWLTFVVVAVLALALTGSKPLENGAVGESARGYALMDAHGLGLPATQYAYLHSDTLTTSSPAFAAATDQAATRIHEALGGPARVAISRDRHAALITAQITRPFDLPRLQASISAVGTAHPGVSAMAVDPTSGGGNDLHRAEQLSIPITLLVLLISFGALVAALVPVLLAATAVIAAFGLLGPISQVFPLDDSVKTVMLLIGMAVGVDYALFYVIRSREERLRGASTREALERTSRTSGRSVLIAGTTVAIAMAGMFVVGSDILNGIAAGTIVVVACAVAGSVTVLPALLQLLGPRIDQGRIPFLPQLATAGESRFWAGVVSRVMRRPVLAMCLSAGLLVALAIPALGMHVAKPSSAALSSASQSELAAKVTGEFPSTSSPAILVATWPARETGAMRQAVGHLETLAASKGLAHPPFAAGLGPDGRSLALGLPLAGFGDNAASRNAVKTLRNVLVPETLGRVPGAQTAVTGDTAQDIDFTGQMRHGIPYVVAFVLALAFVLLLVSFRSIVVPIKAIVLNLMSVGASYGVLVLVFQHHWAQGVLGFRSDGAIISWLPLFLFVILFGLSMDYHVFILSRVREGVDSGMSTDEALRYGIARTAGVVSAAALVMVGVFSLFGTASALDLKEAGVGLAVAVLLDATVVRGVLLPATMKLLGERNWYLPGFLSWLPRAEHARPRAELECPPPALAAASN
ncbi:MAG TPA: MMPL family transporter [Solirubrobacteraceae bacterium]|jgi:RND superfamily putative drug exporter|nr:MMPL family transporter [Solirubrobacteraceae bacterium]